MDKIDLRDVVLRTFLEYGINECPENDLTKIDLAECAEAIVEKLTLHDVSESVATEYAEFCVRCDREKLPLLCLEDYIKQYCC